MTQRSRGRGAIIVISGPSGSGKTTMVRRALERRADAGLFDSATTRPPRKGETPERDYLFLTREEFQKRIAKGEFAEYAESFGNLYGTPARPMQEALERGDVFLLDVDVQGARQIGRSSRNRAGVHSAAGPPDADAAAEEEEV